MLTVSQAFGHLDADAQGRVLRWAADKYRISIKTTHRGTGGGGADINEEHDDERDDTGGTGNSNGNGTGVLESGLYEHFAELYDAAGPKTKDEKVLVAGYWFQKMQGQSSFQSYELNRELKDLGHRVDHITDALSAGIKKSPALVLQLKKSGNTAQARKTYKLTTEGMKTVERMIVGQE